MAASGLMVLEVVMLAIHATGMDAGPAVTNLALIVTCPLPDPSV